jgi:hypothetical protein
MPWRESELRKNKYHLIIAFQFAIFVFSSIYSGLCLFAGIYDNIAPGKSMQNWIEVGIGKQQVVLGLLCRAYQTSPV